MDSNQHGGSLEQLYRVSHKTRHHMRLAGFGALPTIAAASDEALQAVKGIGPVTAPAIRANAQALIENKPVWYNPLPIASEREDAWMFDLETLEVNGRTIPWCLGWCDQHGATQIALVAPVQTVQQFTLPDQQVITLAPDHNAAWEVFAEAMAGSDTAIYHWTGYDVGMLRSTAPRSVKQQLEPRMHDLNRVFTRAISLPIKSTSIKAVSVYFGFPWIGTNDWFEAFMDYRSWLDRDDIDALTRACMYQRADVQSMAWVWRWIIANRSG